MDRELDDLQPLEYGTGLVGRSSSGARLSIAAGTGYSNAQLDDYGRSSRGSFPWRPPVRVVLRARASPADPVGTLGFGFWNDPFSTALGQPGAPLKLPASPQAIWFFYASEHSQLRLSDSVPGHGWKAMSLATPRVPPFLLAPAALAGLVLSRIPMIRRPVMDIALRQARVDEALLGSALQGWATYEISWAEQGVEFRVDGELALKGERPPSGPLGFVAWIDNQFALATRERGLRFGVVQPESQQVLEIAELSISSTNQRPRSG